MSLKLTQIVDINLLCIIIGDAVLTELDVGTGHNHGQPRLTVVIFMVKCLTSFGLDILIIDHVCGSMNVSSQRKRKSC